MGKPVIIGIYKLTSPTQRVYIGQSKNIKETWRTRYKNCNCIGQRYLYHSIKKYGWDAHKKQIIHTIPFYDKEKLDWLEIYYGDLFDCNNPNVGLNIRRCGRQQWRAFRRN